jgi:hypothetical protein
MCTCSGPAGSVIASPGLYYAVDRAVSGVVGECAVLDRSDQGAVVPVPARTAARVDGDVADDEISFVYRGLGQLMRIHAAPGRRIAPSGRCDERKYNHKW